MLNRLPIRLRLTAVFAATMAAVLALIGVVLFFWTRHSIDTSVRDALVARQSAAAALVREQRLDAVALPPGERFAQVLTPAGRVLASRPSAEPPMLTPSQAASAARGIRAFEQHERARYVAGPVTADGSQVVVVVAASLADHERALEGLSGALLVGVPLALLLASIGAYVLAGGALRPVEEMRRRADTISSAAPDARLPEPPVDDELRRLSRTLNAMLRRIGESAEHERRFVASASHELRTPLSALRAELELAERHGGTVDELVAAVARSRDDVDRLIALTDDLLALARTEEATPRLAPVDVDGLLAEAVVPLRDLAARSGRPLVLRPACIRIDADAQVLTRAVRNLIENALLHGTGQVVVGASIPPDAPAFLELWVTDEGAVHPSVRAGRALEPFARGVDAGERPGSGLGLALVDAAARQHGGAAALTEIQGGGVRASLRVRRHGATHPPAS